MIELGEPVLGKEEKQALCDVIDSGWITMGGRVAAFEKAFAEIHQASEAIAVTSCTAGLHLCLAALGIGPGDQVLVPALTFVATVNAVLYTGAEPVFVDIESEDRPHIGLADAEAKCTPKTRAIIVMHYGGYLVDLPAWRSYADRQRLALIEDAAHAPGVGEVGRWGDAAAFSFFTNKNMTTAEGGMVIARDLKVRERIRRMRAHGMTTGTLDRHLGHANSYDVAALGYNYRLDELRAAIGLVQLERLQAWNTRRIALNRMYRHRLAEEAAEIRIPFDEKDETAAHIMPILLPEGVSRPEVMARLRDHGIQSSIHYPPVHRFSYYKERAREVTLPNTEAYYARTLTLPLHPSLKEEDVTVVVNALRDAIG